jgi:hypothetical protein
MEDKVKFRNYSKNKPPCPGWYVWRVRHKTMEDVLITFLAQFRVRGTGFTKIVSPEFDYWDGYKVLLPKVIEWAPYKGEKPKDYNNKVLNINSLYIARCPFCKETPELIYSGRFIGATPIDSEYWQFSCCGWASSPRIINPVKLINRRNCLLMGG